MGLMNRSEFKSWKEGDRIKPVTHTGPESKTKQEFAAESDINVIMKRYLATGQLPPSRQGVFLDVSKIGDRAEILRKVDAARDAFMELSPEVRSRFGNNVESLLEFVLDDANYDEAVRLGLVPPVGKEVKVVKEAAKAAPPEPTK